jgi:hypothetical protein
MAAGFIADHSVNTHRRDGLHDHHADDHQIPECESAPQSRCGGDAGFTAQQIPPLWQSYADMEQRSVCSWCLNAKRNAAAI